MSVSGNCQRMRSTSWPKKSRTFSTTRSGALLADPRSGPVLDDLIAQAKRSPKRPWPVLVD
ncbi:MAG TPA: hypothetical protein VFW76_06150 [Ktedonobacterales bacterium]|nr:hypothetical protein [Ktedonobacterales bacterium]